MVPNGFLIGRPHESRPNREENPSGSFTTDYIGNHTSTSDQPSAYLVELPPGYVIKPHFHGTNQFQVAMAGTAVLGRHELFPGGFHYTDAYTPYGPIVAGPDGFSFFTLRQTAYKGFHEMPGSAHLMQRKAGRSFQAAVDPSREALGTCIALRLDQDGAGAHEVTAPPDQPLPLPKHGHAGAFLVVLAGEIGFGDHSLCPVGSVVWQPRGEAWPPIFAGRRGAVTVQLSYPEVRGDATAAPRLAGSMPVS